MPVGKTEEWENPRERFSEVLKKYTSSEKKLKKKKAETKETVVLQDLKKNLEKETEYHETILQNTFQPEHASPRFIKNKQREREVAEKDNTDDKIHHVEIHALNPKRRSRRELPSLATTEDDQVFQEKSAGGTRTEQTDERAGKRRSKKNKEAKKDTTGGYSEDQLLQEYQQQIAETEEKSLIRGKTSERLSSSSHEAHLNNAVGKKKKKKLKSLVTESDASERDEVHELDDKPSKARRKKQAATGESVSVAQEAQGPVLDDSLVLGVYIHRSDQLKTDPLISHPMVKIHVVDDLTGQYVRKEDSHRPVSSFYEQDNVDHILPIMTQPFDFKKNKSVIPEWQEQIIFNERFGHFVQQGSEGPRVMLFFEILDFISMKEARANSDNMHEGGGFKKIAWAFLKLVGTNGVLNIDSQVRLQLFCPPARAKRQSNIIEVVDWWRNYPRKKYSSTLYVTVKGIKLPEHVDPSIRSMMALQEERGSTSYSELQNEVTKRSLSQPLDNKPAVLRWSRLPGQVNMIPNKHMLSFRGGQMGCFTVVFSHSGTLLAAACADKDAFPVVVYEIPSGKVLAAFNGHLKIVYNLCWSSDDGTLLSASSDGTVREWNVEKLLLSSRKILPHPSFVYCAQYHPAAHNLVVTGGFDSLVRVWKMDVDDVNGLLLKEFDGHSSYINTICFDPDGSRMFSGDNMGQILIWRTGVKKHQQPCSQWRMEEVCFEKSQNIFTLLGTDATALLAPQNISELKGISINMLQLHPNGRCLLIHAKDSILRMMDLRIRAVKKYIGATNYKERIYSTFTPCGSFIFSGSEDGMAYVWNTETGDQVALYSELCFSAPLCGLAFHPHENMVAFCAFAHSQPIHVYLYDRKASQLQVQNSTACRSASVDTRSVSNMPGTATLQETPADLDQFIQAERLGRSVRQQLDSLLTGHQRSSAVVHEPGRLGKNLLPDSGSMRLPFLSSHSALQLPSSLSGQISSPTAVSDRNDDLGSVPQHPGSHFKTPSNDFTSDAEPAQQMVVSRHDYKACRSDELSLRPGDVIQVLYKDNDRWWFGRLDSGLQGYFPASLVVEQNEGQPEWTSERTFSSRTRRQKSPDTHTTQDTTEAKVLAAVGSETDPEESDVRGKKKKKKKPHSTLTDTSGSTGARLTRRPLPKIPTQDT
ncbi:jouberin isoform X2 [Synchiropus splendidus]|uniref:jouberin isoform X2 n=1 Tax=Synchiropus splendidus TaxID=270530 RepID=UPI00237D8CA8|nr:jouberin isoform X2 [Synchiropus splendidus]